MRLTSASPPNLEMIYTYMIKITLFLVRYWCHRVLRKWILNEHTLVMEHSVHNQWNPEFNSWDLFSQWGWMQRLSGIKHKHRATQSILKLHVTDTSHQEHVKLFGRCSPAAACCRDPAAVVAETTLRFCIPLFLCPVPIPPHSLTCLVKLHLVILSLIIDKQESNQIGLGCIWTQPMQSHGGSSCYQD